MRGARHDPLAGRLRIDQEAVDVVARVIGVEARQRPALHENRPEQQPFGFGAIALPRMRVLVVGEPELDCLAVIVGAAVVLDEIAVRATRAVQLGRQQEALERHDRGDGTGGGEPWRR